MLFFLILNRCYYNDFSSFFNRFSRSNIISIVIHILTIITSNWSVLLWKSLAKFSFFVESHLNVIILKIKLKISNQERRNLSIFIAQTIMDYACIFSFVLKNYILFFLFGDLEWDTRDIKEITQNYTYFNNFKY